MPRCRAKPLPLPIGMMPNAVLLSPFTFPLSPFTIPCATSFTVPSPPTATTASKPIRAYCFANSTAWPAYSVKVMFGNHCSLSRVCMINFGNLRFAFCVSLLPEMGLMINAIFFMTQYCFLRVRTYSCNINLLQIYCFFLTYANFFAFFCTKGNYGGETERGRRTPRTNKWA